MTINNTYCSKRIWLFCDGGGGGEAATAAPPGSREAWRKYFRQEAGCAAAAVARNERGRMIDLRWRRLPPVPSTEAEYAALLLGLEMAVELGAETVCCVMDSEIVVGQMRGYFNVNSANLRPLHWRACAAVRRLPHVHFLLIPREWNRLADGLAAQALTPWRDLCLAIEAFNQEIFT